jgi:hypothetical protein
MARKKFSCRLGRHVWTTRIELGEEYSVCALCGATPGRLARPPMSGTDLEWMKMGDRSSTTSEGRGK